jgi:hypothetical protein
MLVSVRRYRCCVICGNRTGTWALNSAGISIYAISHRVRAGNRASSGLQANDPAVCAKGAELTGEEAPASAGGAGTTGPLPFDTTVAHQARVYDYMLGGYFR